MQLECITRAIVSTDDQEITQIASRHGAEVPFIRPAKYAQGDMRDWPVFNHALMWMRNNERYEADIVINLRPTTPNQGVETIDLAIRKMVKHLGLDLLRSVRPAESSPYKMVVMLPDGCIKPGVRPPTCVNELWNMPRQVFLRRTKGMDISTSRDLRLF